METRVEIDQIKFRRGTFCLSIEHLEIQPSSILCVTGPNGSGKSTLLQGLSGLLAPLSGNIRLGNKEIISHLQSVKALVGYIPDDEEWLIKELSAREYLELLLLTYRAAGHSEGLMRTRIANLAKELYFTSYRQRLATMSHGNRKKVQIIAGLMHDPKLLIVDEIRNGLDPLAIKATEKILSNHARRGACVVTATHDLWWAERIANIVLLLIEGKVVIHENKEKLLEKYGSLEKLFISVAGKRLIV